VMLRGYFKKIIGVSVLHPEFIIFHDSIFVFIL